MIRNPSIRPPWWAAVLLAATAPIAPAGDRLAEESRAEEPVAEARERWERLTPEEREIARRRFERFRELSKPEREQWIRSARRLRARIDRTQEELREEAPDQMADLPPERRRAIARDLVAEEAREAGARIRSRMPRTWIERLERARPEDRARFLRQFQVQQRDRVARYAIGELGRRLELPEQEIARLQALPGEERGAAVLDLHKRLSERDVQEHGLPPGLTPEQWETWLALPPEGFFEEFQRYWRSRVGQVARSEEHAASLRELLQAARPRPRDALALASLPPTERRARLVREKRERCLRVIRENALLEPSEIDALAARDDRAFFEGVRRLLRQDAGPPWPPRDRGPTPR